jgi:hypothetical protein
MSMKHTIAVAASALLSSLVLVGLGTEALASKPESKGDTKVEAKQDANSGDIVTGSKDGGQTARFGTLPLQTENITLVAESAKVVIKRVAGSSEIVLESNCPRNWNLQQNGMIRQAGFSGDIRKGSSLLADDLGSRAIVNGHVYLLAQGGMRGIKMGADGVFINGEQIQPLKGSDIPCNCTGEDLLVISVPQSFTGGLRIGSSGNSNIAIDSWKDGALECTLTGNSSLTAGKLESLTKANFDNKGKGAAEIENVNAKIFVASTRGAGSAAIRVKHGNADMSNATVEGNGTIELHGSFKNFKQLVDGTGKIEVKP